MHSLRTRKHVQPFIHVSFHCQARCFHCASSFLFLQPHGRPFAKNQPSPSHTSPSRYVSPASSDSLASGHLCMQAPASSTSGLWAPAPASSDSLVSGHLHMHYIHMYACTPNGLHKRGSGQEAILFLCTCLGDLASLARASDRADPEVCANALLTHAQERPAITPLHVCFHCRARCFHCASSSLILQPHVLRERRETELEREHGRSGSSNSSRHEV